MAAKRNDSKHQSAGVQAHFVPLAECARCTSQEADVNPDPDEHAKALELLSPLNVSLLTAVREYVAMRRDVSDFPRHYRNAHNQRVVTVYAPSRAYGSFRVVWSDCGKRCFQAVRSASDADSLAQHLVQSLLSKPRRCEHCNVPLTLTAPAQRRFCSERCQGKAQSIANSNLKTIVAIGALRDALTSAANITKQNDYRT